MERRKSAGQPGQNGHAGPVPGQPQHPSHGLLPVIPRRVVPRRSAAANSSAICSFVVSTSFGRTHPRVELPASHTADRQGTHIRKTSYPLPALRVSGLRVDVDGRCPASAAKRCTRLPVSCRRRRWRTCWLGRTPRARRCRRWGVLKMFGLAPMCAFQVLPLNVSAFPFAIDGGMQEASRCARHRLQVGARPRWRMAYSRRCRSEVTTFGLVRVDGGAEKLGWSRTRHRAQFVARIYDRGGAPGGPVERERVRARRRTATLESVTSTIPRSMPSRVFEGRSVEGWSGKPHVFLPLNSEADESRASTAMQEIDALGMTRNRSSLVEEDAEFRRLELDVVPS